jgi:cytochrome c2
MNEKQKTSASRRRTRAEIQQLVAEFAQNLPSNDLTANSVFQQNCAKCHGKTAEGRHFGGPPLLSEKVAAPLPTTCAASSPTAKAACPNTPAN